MKHLTMNRPISVSSPISRWMSRLALVCCILPFAPAPAEADEIAEGIRLYYSQHYKEAAPHLMRAAKKGDARAQSALGLMYQEGLGIEQDDKKAGKWFKKAAEQGRADAQTFLGMLYCQGRGVEKDFTIARKWFEKAAIAGNVDAQTFLGNLYYKGIGVAKDDIKAGYWLQKAAIAGDTDAQATLNDMLDSNQSDTGKKENNLNQTGEQTGS